MKNRKFTHLYETIYTRYKQGAGFLEGDLVKLKSNYKSTEEYESLSDSIKAHLEGADKSGYNLRLGRLHSYNTSAGSLGINNGLPATHADLYQEKSPGNFGGLVTVPIGLLEVIDTGVNLAPVSQNNKRASGQYQKPGKWKANKDTDETKEQNHLGHEENWIKNGDYDLATKNKKSAVGANSYDDEKPSMAYKPLAKNKLKPKTLKESEVALNDIYIHILREDDNDMERVKESSLRMPDGTVIDTQKLQSLFAKIDRNMNDNDFYGDIDDAKVYDALRRGDVEGAADEICYSYTGRDGGEVDTEGTFKDIVSSLNYMIRNSKPTGMHMERVKESSLRMPDGTVIDTQKLQSLFAKIDRNMNDNDFYGDIDDAKVYDALRRGDVEGAADEICYSYTGRDGGEVDTEGTFKDIVSSLNYMIRNSKPTGMHPEAEDGKTEMEETFHVQNGETVLTSRTALPQTGDYLPAGTPAWVYYMARRATPEQIKDLMGNIRTRVPGGYGSYKDDSMLPRGLRGVEEEVCPICKRDVCQCNEMEMVGNDMEAPCPKCHTNPCTCLEEESMFDESDLKHHVKDECWNMEENRLVDECWAEDGSVKEECWSGTSNSEPAPASAMTGQENPTGREDGPMEEAKKIKRLYLPGGHPEDGVTIKAHPNSYLS
jgi:hypothetical protein